MFIVAVRDVKESNEKAARFSTCYPGWTLIRNCLCPLRVLCVSVSVCLRFSDHRGTENTEGAQRKLKPGALIRCVLLPSPKYRFKAPTYNFKPPRARVCSDQVKPLIVLVKKGHLK